MLPQQEISLEENLEKRHYHVIREEHERMMLALRVARSHFHNQHKRHPEKNVEEQLKLIDFLEHVLEFSSTWNGVETKEFFTQQPHVHAFLYANNMHRLGEFFARPYATVSKELHARGSEYPVLLKKLYEAYFLGRSMPKKDPPILH